MAFHPHYWARPVRNSSNIYNYAEWNRTSRFAAAQQIGKDTREQPKPQEEMELDPQVRVIAPVGGVLLFSAAQMHSTVPNSTGCTRFSIDFRTVNLDDARAFRGAPNVDSSCTGTTMNDYLRGSDLSHVPAEVIEMYDTAPHEVTVEVSPPRDFAVRRGPFGRYGGHGSHGKPRARTALRCAGDRRRGPRLDDLDRRVWIQPALASLRALVHCSLCGSVDRRTPAAESVARARRGHQCHRGGSGHPRVSLSLAARVHRGDRARLLSCVCHRHRHADRSDGRMAVRADVAMARCGTDHRCDGWPDRAWPAGTRPGAAGALSNSGRETTCVARTHWPATCGSRRGNLRVDSGLDESRLVCRRQSRRSARRRARHRRTCRRRCDRQRVARRQAPHHVWWGARTTLGLVFDAGAHARRSPGRRADRRRILAHASPGSEWPAVVGIPPRSETRARHASPGGPRWRWPHRVLRLFDRQHRASRFRWTRGLATSDEEHGSPGDIAANKQQPRMDRHQRLRGPGGRVG